MASDCSLIAIAERCLSPKRLGICCFLDTGNIQETAWIRSSRIIMAPSCSGLFLKKRFSIKRELMFASIISPVRAWLFKSSFLSRTIKAPSERMDRLRHASTICTILYSDSSLLFSSFPKTLLSIAFNAHFR